MRPLTLLQRQRITLSLFFTVAVGAVFTVAAPAFVPWQVVDDKRTQALDQQRRQGKDFHVIEDRRHRRNQQGSSNSEGGSSTSSNSDSENAKDDGNKSGHQDKQSSVTSTSSTATTISSQGALISLLTDRSKPASPSISTATPIDPSLIETEVSDADSSVTTKKRKRRRKRKMVNEGWQELTGRTAREEKEKQEQQQQQHQNHTQSDSKAPPVLGENGGIEISWKNKTSS